MSASSNQKFRKLRKLVFQVDAEQGAHSKLCTVKDSATSQILQSTTGDEAISKLAQSLVESITKLAKDNVELNVTQRQSEFQQEIKKKRSELVRFGPLYGEDSDSIKRAKDAALNHALQKSGPEGERDYTRAVKEIEDAAMKMYDIPNEDIPKPKEFQQMMVRDGCFFLQLALHILGGGCHLDHTRDHPYFGEDKDSAAWIPDMFFMGNQIPYIVIRVLMKQTFFRDVINNGIQTRTWRCPEEADIAKMALYLTVVRPAFWSHAHEDPPPQFSEPPPNILECLHSLFLGNRAHQLKNAKIQEFESLEAGSNDNNIKIPSVGELSKQRIKLASNKTLRLSRSGIKVVTNWRPGIKNISFYNLGYCAKIYLPTLAIESHTKDLLTSLVKHEQNMNESEREVTAYLRFMRDLVRTHDDFKILEEKRIIVVKDPKLKGKIIQMLEDLATIHNSNFTLTFRHIRQSITDYGGPPWRLISIILGILGIIQTVFTVLAYVHPLK